MKLLKHVPTIEVKRTFVIADHITQRKGRGNNRKYLGALSEAEFDKRLRSAKKMAMKLTEHGLNKLISPGYPKRVNSYDMSRWYLAQVSPAEIGVWKRAGNLPLAWTNRSLRETADHVRRALERGSRLLKGRPKHGIPNITHMKTHLEQREKYLYPIVFLGGTGTNGRRGLKRRTKGDIDDGCMRSVALAMSGRDPITVYFGVPRR